jgi:hypothetical protein
MCHSSFVPLVESQFCISLCHWRKLWTVFSDGNPTVGQFHQHHPKKRLTSPDDHKHKTSMTRHLWTGNNNLYARALLTPVTPALMPVESTEGAQMGREFVLWAMGLWQNAMFCHWSHSYRPLSMSSVVQILPRVVSVISLSALRKSHIAPTWIDLCRGSDTDPIARRTPAVQMN